MPKIVVSAVILLLVGGGGLYLYKNYKSQPTPAVRVSQPNAPEKNDPCERLVNGNSQLPPLYKDGVTWGLASPSAQEVTEFADISTGQGFQKTTVNGCLIQGTTSWDNNLKLRSYYTENLGKSWKTVNVGDQPRGSYIIYKDGTGYFVLTLNNTTAKLFFGH